MATAIRRHTDGHAPWSPLATACGELEEVVLRFADLVRSAPDPAAPAVGTWTVADVAAHVSHVCAAELMAARTLGPSPRESLPEGDDFAEAAASFNAWNLAGDPERDLGAVADRIEERAAEFVAYMRSADADAKASWLCGVVLPAPALAAHLVFEFLVHGFDIASAGRRRWPIKHSAAVLASCFFPRLMKAANPTFRAALVDHQKAAGVNATFDVKIRGGDRTFFVFQDGVLNLEDPSDRPVDCHISADPAAFMLVGFGRMRVSKPALMGRMVAWGRRPLLAFKLPSLLRTP
ncbi:MAG: maleylpyruvate isomerase N-terminal domain-containing protein [Actinomycetota bacterium]